jgi:hypothetical protein
MVKQYYDPSNYIGEYIKGVTLETCREDQKAELRDQELGRSIILKVRFVLVFP